MNNRKKTQTKEFKELQEFKNAIPTRHSRKANGSLSAKSISERSFQVFDSLNSSYFLNFLNSYPTHFLQ